MTAKDIQNAVVGFSHKHLWSPATATICFNSSGVVGWEADILVIHKSGFAWEIEVKVSLSDFKREFTEKIGKHKALQSGLVETRSLYQGHKPEQKHSKIKQFYFAVPKDLYPKIKDLVPEYAGIIVVDEIEMKHSKSPFYLAKTIKKAKNLPAERCDGPTIDKAVKVCYWQYWHHVARSSK